MELNHQAQPQANLATTSNSCSTTSAQPIARNSSLKGTNFRVFSYENVATVIQSHKLAVANLKDAYGRPFIPQGIIALARGGIVPGSMVASREGLPMYILGIARKTTNIEWLSRPPRVADVRLKVLAVDDFISSGDSLYRAQKFLEGEGLEVKTEVLFYDKSKTRLIPDVGGPIEQWACFPWDNLENKPQDPKEASRTHVGLEERDKLAFTDSLTVSEIDNVRQLFPEQTKFLMVGKQGEPVSDLAQTILSEGVSCFFTGKAEQAVAVGNLLPSMNVYWWDRNTNQVFCIRANISL